MGNFDVEKTIVVPCGDNYVKVNTGFNIPLQVSPAAYGVCGAFGGYGYPWGYGYNCGNNGGGTGGYRDEDDDDDEDYNERRGVPGTGRYGRRRYGRRTPLLITNFN